MDGKKVLFILDHLKGGGAERIALEVAESFHKDGHEIIIVLLDDNDSRMLLPSNIKKVNINLDPIFYSGKFWRKRREKFNSNDKQKIRNLIDEFEPNLIILSHNYAHLILPAFRKDENVWAWIHSDIVPLPEKNKDRLFHIYKEKRRRYLECKSFIHIFNNRNIIVVNKDFKTLYQAYLPKANIVVIPNGVNVERVVKNISLNAHKEWDCIFVGRLSPEKQPDHAIRAFAKSGLKGRMAIVGDGILENQMLELCAELKIKERVDFLGWQEDPSEFISKSKCLILSSNIEGSPLIIAEAITIGTPVVAYRINSGIDQQLNYAQLKCGLVENQNIESLSTKIHDVVKSPYKISQSDKDRVTLDNMTKLFSELF